MNALQKRYAITQKPTPNGDTNYTITGNGKAVSVVHMTTGIWDVVTRLKRLYTGHSEQAAREAVAEELQE